MVDRRDFLAAAAAAAIGSAEAAPQLAVNGGTPGRSKPLGGPTWGPQYYDGKEQQQLAEVLGSHKPVRMEVHLHGNPAEMDPILAIARKHNLKVLEDASQSVGASYKGKPLGSMGDIGIYSLQQSKTITAGEGGALVTSDPYLFERACRFHDVTVRKDFPSKLGFIPGLNYRMNEFTGGVLLAQLRKLDTIIGDVRRNARRVYGGLRDLPGVHPRHPPDPQGELRTR